VIGKGCPPLFPPYWITSFYSGSKSEKFGDAFSRLLHPLGCDSVEGMKPVRSNLRDSVILALFLCCLAGSIGMTCSPLGPFWIVRQRGATAVQANSWLWHCQVPDAATAVDFKSGYQATTVQCSLDEIDFVEWCKQRDWHPLPIDRPVFVPAIEGGLVEIAHGLRFEIETSGSVTRGTYDADNRRVYLEHFST
jgi:hypothetical protein